MQLNLKRDMFTLDEAISIAEGMKVSKGDGSADDPVSRQMNAGVLCVVEALKSLILPGEGFGSLCFLAN